MAWMEKGLGRFDGISLSILCATQRTPWLHWPATCSIDHDGEFCAKRAAAVDHNAQLRDYYLSIPICCSTVPSRWCHWSLGSS